MIFVNNISELQYYHSAEPYGCYSDAIFSPLDMSLQANGFALSSPVIAVTVNVCSVDGSFQEDGTAYFDIYFASFMLGGTTYYFVNIRGNSYSDYMLSNKCYVLNVVITNAGVTLFNKWTQQYKIASVVPGSFVPEILIDGVPTAPCIPGANPALCGEEYVKLQTSFDCFDVYTGDYYATGSAITGIPFTYTRYSYIPGRFRDLPTEVERIISINNRTQKTGYTAQYTLTGNVAFPVWKMKDIEGMLRGNKLFVDDVERQSIGGKVFEQVAGVPVNCVYMYKMAIPFQGNFEWQMYGCQPDCSSLATYYLFPAPFERLYDDSMRLIAQSPDTLAIYLDSLPGTSEVAQLPFVAPCPVYATLKVISSGVLPKFLYVDQPIAQQRIFPKQLPVNTTDLSPLCNGVTNNNQVPVPDVTGEDDIAISVPVPDITGEDDVDYNEYMIAITPAPGWLLSPNYSSAVQYGGEGTLNMSWSTGAYSGPFTNMVLGVMQSGMPSRDILITSTDNGNMPPASTLLIEMDGTITYSGQETSTAGSTYYIELFNIKYPL